MAIDATAVETELCNSVCTLNAQRETDQSSLQSCNDSGNESFNASALPRAPGTTKTQRRSPRIQIQELQQQIESLQREIDALRVNELLAVDSLEQFLHPSRCRPRWRLIATQEKQATCQSTAENVRLEKRLIENLQLIRRARRLVQTQTAFIQVSLLSALAIACQWL